MLTDQLKEASIHYLTNSEGKRTAVVVDIDAWEALIEALEDIEDAQEMERARDEGDDLIAWDQVVKDYGTEHPDVKV